MAEPRTSVHIWKGSIILLVVLLDISTNLYAAIVLFPFLRDCRIKHKEVAKSIVLSTGDIIAVEVVM
jgi:hypothetical protein